jgi:serine/threonine protein kinase
MGSVWLAEHLALCTEVVVKFIADDRVHDEDAAARFSREAALAASVKSPHVVQTFDYGITESGAPYIVMERLDGRDLATYLREEGRAPAALVVRLVMQLARALDRAHERGLVHRDIKPANIFLCDAGGGEVFVKLLDFGVAKNTAHAADGSGTRTGSVVGTPHYMSPEQILGERTVDARSDLWSLGVVAFEALLGKRPFEAETMGALAILLHQAPLPVPSSVEPSSPKALDSWFRKACARLPEERFQTATELAAALEAVFSVAPETTRVPGSRRFLAAVAIAALSTGGLAAAIVKLNASRASAAVATPAVSISPPEKLSLGAAFVGSALNVVPDTPDAATKSAPPESVEFVNAKKPAVRTPPPTRRQGTERPSLIPMRPQASSTNPVTPSPPASTTPPVPSPPSTSGHDIF